MFDSVSAYVGTVFSNFNKYLSAHHDGIVAVSLFAGVIMTFTGHTLLNPTVFLLGFLPSFVTIAAFSFAFIDETNPANPNVFQVIAIILAIVVATIVGILVMRLLFRIVIFFICAAFGAVLVLTVNLFLLEPSVGPNALVFLYSFVILAALFAGLFSVSYPETGIILGTSFDGAAVAVFSLARFLGHRPRFLSQIPKDTQIPPVWAIGYAATTLILAAFGAVTQRQLATASKLIRASADLSKSPSDNNINSANMDVINEQQNLLPYLIEPPRTPVYERAALPPPVLTHSYGAADQDDSQYSVIHNLGAEPLPISIDMLNNNTKDSKNSNLPM